MSSYISTEWYQQLVTVCQNSSQKAVGQRLGYAGGSIVSQILKGTYPGDVDQFRQRFEGAYMGACVQCPVAGEIGRDQCLTHQRRPFCGTNPLRVQLYRVCRSGCQYSSIVKGES